METSIFLANFGWYLDSNIKIEYILPNKGQFGNRCKLRHFVLHNSHSSVGCLLRVLNDFPSIAHVFLINIVKFVDDGTEMKKMDCDKLQAQ